MAIDNSTHNALERSIKEIDWNAIRKPKYYESPAAWEDQVLYFLMLDRFSNDREQGYTDNDGKPTSHGKTPLFSFSTDAYKADRTSWADAGDEWLGGTLKGLQSKIGYLQRMGVTAIWISPVFKQVASDQHSYHGYGIQNFLDVDKNFGTREDLIELVNVAHSHGIRIILDLILNHAGNIFGYKLDPNRYPAKDDKGHTYIDPRWDGKVYPVEGYRDASGAAILPFQVLDMSTHGPAWPDGAVWPSELQPSDTYTSKGRIDNWDYDPEFMEGDFVSLKDIHHGEHTRDSSGQRVIDDFTPSPALNILCDVYKFWIALTDVDGFRIDTVKHMELGATRYFASVIKEFAQSLGKEHFFLVGEITGGRSRAFETLDLTGLDAALGIDEIPDKLDYLAKGWREPSDYFGLFRNSVQERRASHVWFGKHVVTLFDDHDQVRKGKSKARFCGDKINRGFTYLKAVLGLNLTSMGIPCIYYGTEQGFDGAGESDRFLRECMFGGDFGSLQSTDRHFFNEQHEIYRFLVDVLELRSKYLPLRRGRQYLREISDSGAPGTFGTPRMIGGQIRSVVPWSRLFANQEILLAINTDADNPRSAWVTIDNSLHSDLNSPAGRMTCLYSTNSAQINTTTLVEARNGSAVHVTVPPAGFVIFI